MIYRRPKLGDRAWSLEKRIAPADNAEAIPRQWLVVRRDGGLAIMMGGRVAEKLVFGHEKVTSGADSDIEQATKLARMMVTRWGLSDALGTVAYGENQDEVFLGYQVARQQNVSEETSRKIDAEIRRLVEAGAEDSHREARRPRNPRQGCSNSRHSPATKSRMCSPANRRPPHRISESPRPRAEGFSGSARASPKRQLPERSENFH